MNIDILKGHWNEAKGKIKSQWGKLTDDDIAQLDGSSDQLLGKIQKAYGYQKDEAKKELDSFIQQHGWKDKEFS